MVSALMQFEIDQSKSRIASAECTERNEARMDTQTLRVLQVLGENSDPQFVEQAGRSIQVYRFLTEIASRTLNTQRLQK